MRIDECGTHQYVECDTTDILWTQYDYDREIYSVSKPYRSSDGTWVYTRMVA